VKTITRHTEGI